jgi:hypothetical protein
MGVTVEGLFEEQPLSLEPSLFFMSPLYKQVACQSISAAFSINAFESHDVLAGNYYQSGTVAIAILDSLYHFDIGSI